MRRPQGYAQWFGDDTVEMDTMTCFHCNAVKHVPPMQRPEDLGGLCKQCMQLICSDPRCHERCDPFEKKLQRMEASYHARRSYIECS